MLKQKSGFTIVELLIVIVVIAILAAITVVAYNGIRTRSQASALASDLKATEKSLNLYKTSIGLTSWWGDPDTATTGVAGGNPQIAAMIAAKPQLKDVLQKEPTTNGLNGSAGWFYDSDNDVYSGCDTSLAGVNLAYAVTSTSDVIQALDTSIDDGNLSCGKVRYSGGFLLYTVSNGP